MILTQTNLTTSLYLSTQEVNRGFHLPIDSLGENRKRRIPPRIRTIPKPIKNLAILTVKVTLERSLLSLFERIWFHSDPRKILKSFLIAAFHPATGVSCIRRLQELSRLVVQIGKCGDVVVVGAVRCKVRTVFEEQGSALIFPLPWESSVR